MLEIDGVDRLAEGIEQAIELDGNYGSLVCTVSIDEMNLSLLEHSRHST